MKFRTRRLVNHNLRDYPEGTEIELNSNDSAELLRLGAIEEFHKPFQAKRVFVSIKTEQENDNV